MSVKDAYPKELDDFKRKHFPYGVTRELALELYRQKKAVFGKVVEDLADGIAINWEDLEIAGLELWLSRSLI